MLKYFLVSILTSQAANRTVNDGWKTEEAWVSIIRISADYTHRPCETWMQSLLGILTVGLWELTLTHFWSQPQGAIQRTALFGTFAFPRDCRLVTEALKHRSLPAEVKS